MSKKLIHILIVAMSMALLMACSTENSGGDSPYNPAEDTQAPVIKVFYSNVDITGVEQITISNSQLRIGSLLVASWTDNATHNCTVSMKIDGNEVTSGSVPIVSGTLTLTVTDAAGNASTATITLVLKEVHPDITVYMPEVNVYGGVRLSIRTNQLSIGGETVMAWNDRYDNNCTVTVTQGDRTLVDGDTLSEPGTLDVTVTNRQGKSSSAEIILVSKAPYRPIAITDLQPGEILPIVDQVELGDEQCYYHIEHLRLAEATRIRDMMWEYGAGNYSVDEYRQLMDRLNVSMLNEVPLGYSDFEIIGPTYETPSHHAHKEWHILETLVKHVNNKLIWEADGIDEVTNYFSSHPSSLLISGCSNFADLSKESYDGRPGENSLWKTFASLDNVVQFVAGSNIRRLHGVLTRLICQENAVVNDSTPTAYSFLSNTNGKNDEVANYHLIGTFSTNKNGDVDQTNENYESSRFPVGFHDDVCFSGRAFPAHSSATDMIEAEQGKYATSYCTYVNVAMASIAFQLKADTKDADELLDMLRLTSLTDYIHYEGQTQPLHLINLAGVIQKYLMPEALPTTIGASEAIPLEPGYYHGVFFDIPGAEVLIDGEWVRISAENEQLIKAQNPFALKWRLSGEQLLNIGYQPGETVIGMVKLIDDQWGGLRLEKEFQVTLH